MAIVLYGAIVTQIKGRVGSSVFQKLGSSLGLRNYSHFSSSNSSVAQIKRFNMLQAAQYWASLSPASKATWIAQAPTYPATNRYGVAIVLTGYQLFIKVNKRLLGAGISFVSSASAYTLQPYLSCTVGYYSQGGSYFGFDVLVNQAANTATLFYISPVMGKGESTRNIKYKYWIKKESQIVGSYNLWSLLPDEYKTFDDTRFGFMIIAMDVSKLTGCYNTLTGKFSNV